MFLELSLVILENLKLYAFATNTYSLLKCDETGSRPFAYFCVKRKITPSNVKFSFVRVLL